MPTPTIAIDARLVAGSNTGDSTYWTGLLNGLSDLDAPARFLLFTNDPHHRSIPVPSNFRWVLLRSRSSRWWSMAAFPTAARRMGAQLLHTQYTLSPLAGRFGVTTIHDVSFFVGPEWFRPRDRLLLQRSIPMTVRRAKAVITVSETSRQEIERFIPAAKGKTESVYNACPTWVRPRSREAARLQVAADFGIETPYVLTVGTRWPRKNAELAVRACGLLGPEIPHRLILTGKAGWGDQSEGSRGLAVGYVSNDQLCHLYSGADLFLFPSLHEGFGIPLLEAFRCGCPVLCSTGGALPEVAGGAAAVEPSWTPEGWADRIRSLLDDSSKLDELRRLGREREACFTWLAAARKTFDVYMRALA